MEERNQFRRPIYSSRISLEEYERNRREYTEKKLQDLARTYRQNPQFTEQTLYFQKNLRPFEIRSLMWELLIDSILLFSCLIWIISSMSTNLSEMKTDFQESAPTVICGTNKNDPFGKWLVSQPIMIIVNTVLFFIPWIIAMQLKELQIQKQSSTPNQEVAVAILKRYNSLIFTYLVIFLGVITIHYAWKDKTECENEVSQVVFKLLNTPVFQTAFGGVMTLVLTGCSSLYLNYHVSVLLVFTLFFYLLYSVLKLFKDIKKSSPHLVILVLGIFLIALFVSDNLIIKPELIILVFPVASFLLNLKLLIQKKRSQPQLNNFIGEELILEEN